MALAEFIGLGPRDVRGFGVAGLLHDLGKVRIPLEVLTKAGKLTDEEWKIMRAIRSMARRSSSRVTASSTSPRRSRTSTIS